MVDLFSALLSIPRSDYQTSAAEKQIGGDWLVLGGLQSDVAQVKESESSNNCLP